MSADEVARALQALQDPVLRERVGAGEPGSLAGYALTAEEMALLVEAARSDLEVTGYGFVEGVLVAVLTLGGGGAAVAATGGAPGLSPAAPVEHVVPMPDIPVLSHTSFTAEELAAFEGIPVAAPAPTHFEVSVVSATFVDGSRSTPARGSTPAAPDRTLPTTLYVPEGNGPFPLVVFAHGYSSSVATYDALLRDVAAGGFVVAAPDFPLTSTALGSAVGARDIVAQAADVSFVITGVTELSSRPGALQGLVDRGPVAVMGHSDGGATAAGVAFADSAADSRVGAAVILSGARGWFSGGWFDAQSPPLLAIHGTADEINPFSSSRGLVAGATGEKHLVAVDGGSHIGPFTTDETRDEVSTVIVDFLRSTLGHDPAAADAFVADAGAPGLALMS